jgi:hypothetical protein
MERQCWRELARFAGRGCEGVVLDHGGERRVALYSLVEGPRGRNVGDYDVVKLVFVLGMCVDELLALFGATNGEAN